MLSKRLKTLREEKGLTQQQLADVVNLSQQTIGHYEVGRANPDTITLQKLADILDCTVDYLLGRSDVRAYPYIQGAHIEGDTPVTEESLNIIEAELKKIREELKRNKEK